MNKPRGKEVQLDIELHFEGKDELPESKRIDHAVRIVRVKEKGEFFVEKDVADASKVRINAGGLALTVSIGDFLQQVRWMFKEDVD